MRTPSSEPEWIDVSPDAPPMRAPQIEPQMQPEGDEEHEEERHTRWIHGWSTLKWLLFLAAAIGATRWVTWRQSVMYEPPIQISTTNPTPPVPTSTSRTLRAVPESSKSSAPAAEVQKRVTVHIVGRVKKPGVIQMGAGARLKDAIFQAGGTLPNADLEAINLAEPLEDGRQYRVLAKSQSAPQVLGASSVRPRNTHIEMEDALVKPKPKSSEAPLAPVDLNRADATQLQELPGVGPSTAQKIIEHRDEIGGFKSVDDLDGVKGIGPKKLEKIRPFALVR